MENSTNGNKVILGLDLDGVLYDWHDACYVYHQYELDYGGTYRQFWTEYFPSLTQERRNYLVSIDTLYDTKVPTQSVMDFLEFCERSSDAVYYLTSRSKDLERITRRYLSRNNFPSQDNLVMTTDKASACRLFGVTHFLDDFTQQVESVSKVTNAYLMAKLWNKDAQHRLPTVHSLEEFRQQVFA